MHQRLSVSKAVASSHDFKLLSPVLPVVLLARLAAWIGRPRVIMKILTAGNAPPRSKAFAGFEPTATDVIVGTFIKSGTNWALQICQQIAHRGAAEFDHIHDVVPWPESLPTGYVRLSDPRPPSPTGLRVIKTHLYAQLVPYASAARYVSIIRDPKEVLVSAYVFLLGLLGVRDRVSPEQWTTLWLAPGCLGSAWAKHTASWWALRERPNVLVRSYNQVKADRRGTVAAIAALLGVELDASELAAVLERSSFAHMQIHEARFAPPRLPLTKREQFPSMIRRGAVGRSDELLGPEARARVDAFSREQLAQLGSDFPYDELFG